MDNPNVCDKRQCHVRDQAMAAEKAPKRDHDLFNFAAYCGIHGFPRPPLMGMEEWATVCRFVEETGPICTNSVWVPDHARKAGQ